MISRFHPIDRDTDFLAWNLKRMAVLSAVGDGQGKLDISRFVCPPDRHSGDSIPTLLGGRKHA
jgi:hypothetical protein